MPTFPCPNLNCGIITQEFSSNSSMTDDGVAPDNNPSTCSNGKRFPGTQNGRPYRFESFGPFRGPGNPAGCLTVSFFTLDCGRSFLLMAFIKPFNETNPFDGYLGDQGATLEAQQSGNFSFLITDCQEVYIVAQSGSNNTCNFGFSIDWGTCP
jgi:hypothetical protein